jgi:GSH-dependent disulfide-bond oxidoreductase
VPMTLYHGDPNGPSLTVLATLFEKGLEADLVRLDLTQGARHGVDCPRNTEVDMSIEGEGPVLVVDGEAMADSVFIACYLDEIGQGAKIVPAEAYARWEMMMWCRQIIERVAPAAAFLGTKAHLAGALAAMPDADFETMTRPIASADLKARWADIRSGHFDSKQLADCEAKIDQAVARIEKQMEGREWLMGDFTVADLETYAWVAGMVDLVPLAFTHAPRTRAWLERVKARPSVMRALSLARVADPRQSWAPGPEINRWG